MIFKLLSKLPFGVLYFLSDWLAFLAHHVVRYRRQVVYDNLRRCFPEHSERERKAIASGFYRNLADVIVEAVKSISITRESMARRVVFKNDGLLRQVFSNGQPAIILASHQCNWEWVLLGFNVHFKYPMDAVYKPLTNKRHDKLMYDTRSRFGGNPIPTKSAVKEIIQRSKSARAFGLVADQLPRVRDDKRWTKFFGHDTAFFTGADYLARLIKAPVFYFAMHRTQRGHYEIEVINIAQPPYEKGGANVIDKYAGVVEKEIRKYPADWLWSHKRWKYARSIYQ